MEICKGRKLSLVSYVPANDNHVNAAIPLLK